jgi:predicted dehydrogenase/threonine dehydrogenase-like Zn-dependent dehydrogenase
MLQLLQNLGTGETLLATVPAPLVSPGHLLIATSKSLVSAGTERMLVDFGRASLLDKARQQPEKVKMVLDKVRTDGLFATLDAVRSKLDQPLALGYCNVGTVIEVGRGVEGFAPGDRVVSNGPHAEIVRVPRNLCARVPDSVDDERAAFTVLASIGLQGIRLAAPTLGENVVVTGLGLIGLVTVQMLRASGCRVLGVDLDAKRLAMAQALGAHTCDISRGEDPVAAGLAFSGGRGVDAVLITASTKSSLPVEQAAKMSRKRGRIVLVGVTGLELNRSDFYEKEISFQVSCSYGPGRYDEAYEARGQDYPFGLVRWTEQRNFEAVLALMESGAIDVSGLISHRYPLREAGRAYETLLNDRAALGIVLSYDPSGLASAAATRSVRLTARTEVPCGPQDPVLAMVGAGNYGSRVLLPALVKTGARLDTLVTSAGVSGVHHGRRAGFETASTDFAEGVLANQRINTVVIASRHDSHAELAAQCLAAGLNVFVEKPLALDEESLAKVEALAKARPAASSGGALIVGFNRRFAPLVVTLKQLLQAVSAPKCFVYTVNAGFIPAEHWTQQREVGGGRILGEGCHFIDLLRHLAGSPIVAASITTIGRGPAVAVRDDNASISLEFGDGSIGSVHYFANGSKEFPKERLEVFCDGGVLVLDNFVRLMSYGWRGFRKRRLLRQDKGQAACISAFIDAVRTGGPAPIPLDELIEVSRVSIRLAEAQRGAEPGTKAISLA